MSHFIFFSSLSATNSSGVRCHIPGGPKKWDPGAEPRWGSGSEAPRSRRYLLNVRVNKAIDRHKSRTVQSDNTLKKKFQLRRGRHAPMFPLATPLHTVSKKIIKQSYQAKRKNVDEDISFRLLLRTILVFSLMQLTLWPQPAQPWPHGVDLCSERSNQRRVTNCDNRRHLSSDVSHSATSITIYRLTEFVLRENERVKEWRMVRVVRMKLVSWHD